MTQTIEQLLAAGDPAWPGVARQLDSSSVMVQLLPVDRESARRTLHALQVTPRSVLGALALNCGGLLLDHGWLRVLGGGTGELPSLSVANGMIQPVQPEDPTSKLIIAFDVLGGSFAINGGELQGPVGEVFYFGPDTLEWSPIGGGTSQFLAWATSDGLAPFYEALRWPEWELEVEPLPPDMGIAVFPFLYTAEGRDVASAKRSRVPFSELIRLQDEAKRSLIDSPDGTQFTVQVEP